MVTVVSVREVVPENRGKGRGGRGAEGDGSLAGIGEARREKNKRRAKLELWSRTVAGSGRRSRLCNTRFARLAARLSLLSQWCDKHFAFDNFAIELTRLPNGFVG